MTDAFRALAADEIAARFPRTATYPLEWILQNQMGPNALWLLEDLMKVLAISPGSRVLDLGCGRAMTSIFLAQQLDLQVWAADLWIKPTENFTRISEAGLADRIFPIYAEAHALPFADNFFDAIVSIDSFHYYGTDDLYMPYLAKFLKPGGQIGIVVPGLTYEFDELPAKMEKVWRHDFYTFHSAEWWGRHWRRSGVFETVDAALIENGPQMWKAWLDISVRGEPPIDVELVDTDAGELLGFTRMIGTKKQDAPKYVLD